MSLLQDAIKAKQRERAERAQPDANRQLAVEGFFPYSSSSLKRSPSRRGWIFAVVAIGVVLLAAAAWLAWPDAGKVPTTAGRPPIILPPPVTVAKRPPVVDSAKTAVVDNSVTAIDQPRVTAGPDHQLQSSLSQPRERSGSREEPLARPAASSVPSEQRVESPEPAAVERPRIRPVAVDYEAQATLLFNAGDLAGARQKFEVATKVAPSARVWTNYGVTLQRLGDLAGAVAAYRTAVGVDPNYLEAWLYQGRVAAEQGELARAVPLLHRALAINPLNADANVELARLEYEAQNWTEARRFAEAALRGDATNIRANWYLGVASDPLKDVDAAIRGYSGYLRYVGDTPDQTRFVGWARTRLAELGRKP